MRITSVRSWSKLGMVGCAGRTSISQDLNGAGVEGVCFESRLLVRRLIDAVRILLSWIRFETWLSGCWYLLYELTLRPS